jgi:hypothetical protein
MILFSTQRCRETELHRVLCATPKLCYSVLNLKFCLWVFVFLSLTTYSQKTLALNYYSLFGKEKRFEFYTNSNFTYKLKGQLFYHTKKLTNMQDSILVFADESVILLNEIKAVRVKGFPFSRYLIGAGIIFTGVDIINNALWDHRPIVNERALTVSAYLIGAGLLVKCIENKHVRIRKSSTFRIMDIDTQHLNTNK